MIHELALDILSNEGSFELCVHIDGSNDDTEEVLRSIDDPRLKISCSCNAGRANAIREAVGASRGSYVMIFDDDDVLYSEGLKTIIQDCSKGIEEASCGFIYHMDLVDGQQRRDLFPRESSNFISLRADCRVKGDKKEVVKGGIMRQKVHDIFAGYRRIPTSLLWSSIAMQYDVVCREVSVGQKRYLADGMTSRIQTLKLQNARPQAKLYSLLVSAFFRGRYRSGAFLFKALAGAGCYHLLSVFSRIAAAGDH